MSYAEKNIVHENGKYWVLRKGIGQYEVYCAGVTHSVCCTQISFRDDDPHALRRAVAECNRRAIMDS